jgi:hypothetical protein
MTRLLLYMFLGLAVALAAGCEMGPPPEDGGPGQPLDESPEADPGVEGLALDRGYYSLPPANPQGGKADQPDEEKGEHAKTPQQMEDNPEDCADEEPVDLYKKAAGADSDDDNAGHGDPMPITPAPHDDDAQDD